jgi:hypothetical protein
MPKKLINNKEIKMSKKNNKVMIRLKKIYWMQWYRKKIEESCNNKNSEIDLRNSNRKYYKIKYS